MVPPAWIHTGTGRLYGPPFVSRCLLYRLYDVSLALLIHHEPTVSSATDTEAALGVTAFKTVVREPSAIYVHHVRSVKGTLKGLAEAPPARLDINTTSTLRQSFGEIMLEVEPLLLPLKDMFILGSDCGRSSEYQIARTAYWVKGPARMARLGTGSGGGFRCWKVSVLSGDGNTTYDFFSAHDWALAALSTEKDLQPTVEIRRAREKSRPTINNGT